MRCEELWQLLHLRLRGGGTDGQVHHDQHRDDHQHGRHCRDTQVIMDFIFQSDGISRANIVH